ncbi:Cap15 family cyclic dinucleotide receptor domain-containing protein [Brucella intermedia]|uniref:Cap15 family cyclic dinucleotide receptor domain-containing protein n=1 Tax=Brucella intermedia TaxID=94625 RepID=UPI0021C90326|nr:hypothetical protein [Brucella intermedia]UXO85560.1 hypothetical protein N8I72_14425 [Brucella intermedia]
MTEHEYSVVGHSRASIGRYLSILSAALASAFTLVGTLWLQFATYLGLPPWANFLAIPLSGGLIYGIVHWTFNKWCWRWFFRLVGLPNISGNWSCKGQTYDNDGKVAYEWEAVVTITQSWEKIKVHLRTAQSSSSSVSAALIPEGGGRWLLMYSYRNEPRIGEIINSHLGYCEMSFESGCEKGDGDYFTARGRATQGRMIFTRGA